ncbi:MAG: histidinol dehydrogenase, partial [Clostridia bacterium]|nr:histidinol dehydrogenase [Clostridia bacterium]
MIRIMKLGDLPKEEILKRELPTVKAEKTVTEILKRVREEGDAALYAFTEKYDGVRIDSLEVPKEEIRAAVEEVGPDFMRVLERAAGNIRVFHEKQKRDGFFFTREDGVVLGQRVVPVDRAGVYVPGGTAPLCSTVLMDVLPAKIAGCPEVILTTPPGRDGKIAPAILAAAFCAGADRVFRIGGAQAIAAMAFGTESIPRVDKIVGPGNAYVAEAKRQVYGRVAIDTIAGPSEILVLADATAEPRLIAADILAQAEHDVLSCPILVTDSAALAEAVQVEIELQLQSLERQEIARAAIEDNGKIIVAADLRRGMEIANAVAPEHLEICVDHPFDYLDAVKNAGSVFLGKNCPEPLG